MISTWEYGAGLRHLLTVRNAANDLVDPDTLTFKYKEPSGAVTTLVYGTDPEVVRESLGIFYVDHQCLAGGSWAGQWLSTGPAGGTQAIWNIEPSVI